VLIEATVVEVTLNDRYQGGVDWSRITSSLMSGLDGVNIEQQLLGSNLSSAPTFLMSYEDQNSDGTVISASVRLLNQYGDTQVLSSPKIMALNNQTSILKVVDNRVYFTIDVDISQNQTQSLTTFETNIHTVPVGLVMSLVPYISDSEEVILNIRPTISRILRFVNDPNPALAQEGVISPVPEIQVREMESVLRLNNGQIAVIGGLMQDSSNKLSDGVPGLSRVPGLGEAFKYRDDQIQKTELVIFLRTTVIKEPGLDGDLRQFREFLPARRAGK
jgi:general secretion pathway protein D